MPPKKQPARDFPKEAKAILDECRKHLQTGLGGKTLSAAADRGLFTFYEAKIIRRLKTRGSDWRKEKANPLVVAEHIGQIAAILTQGSTVSLAVARAAAVAARLDEICPVRSGAGQWCV